MCLITQWKNEEELLHGKMSHMGRLENGSVVSDVHFLLEIWAGHNCYSGQ